MTFVFLLGWKSTLIFLIKMWRTIPFSRLSGSHADKTRRNITDRFVRMSVTAQAPSHQDAFTFSTQFLPFYGTLDTEQADLQFYVLHKGLLFKQAQLGNLNNRKKKKQAENTVPTWKERLGKQNHDKYPWKWNKLSNYIIVKYQRYIHIYYF